MPLARPSAERRPLSLCVALRERDSPLGHHGSIREGVKARLAFLFPEGAAHSPACPLSPEINIPSCFYWSPWVYFFRFFIYITIWGPPLEP